MNQRNYQNKNPFHEKTRKNPRGKTPKQFIVKPRVTLVSNIQEAMQGRQGKQTPLDNLRSERYYHLGFFEECTFGENQIKVPTIVRKVRGRNLPQKLPKNYREPIYVQLIR